MLKIQMGEMTGNSGWGSIDWKHISKVTKQELTMVLEYERAEKVSKDLYSYKHSVTGKIIYLKILSDDTVLQEA